MKKIRSTFCKCLVPFLSMAGSRK